MSCLHSDKQIESPYFNLHPVLSPTSHPLRCFTWLPPVISATPDHILQPEGGTDFVKHRTGLCQSGMIFTPSEWYTHTQPTWIESYVRHINKIPSVLTALQIIVNNSLSIKRKEGRCILAVTAVHCVPNHWLLPFAHWAANETVLHESHSLTGKSRECYSFRLTALAATLLWH